jgi:hypothetical protein
MYAVDPAGIESYLMLLDEIKAFASNGSTNGGMSKYLSDSGYGASTVCGRSLIDGEDIGDGELVERLVSVWKAYLDLQES